VPEYPGEVTRRHSFAALALSTLGLTATFASACASAPPTAPTLHVVSEPPRDAFLCRAEPPRSGVGRRGPRGMGPRGMGPRGMGPRGMGPHGMGPREMPAGAGPMGPPPPWPTAAAAPGSAPAPTRGRAHDAPAAAPAFEVALARADAAASGWETEVRVHSAGAALGPLLVELGRVSHLALVVSPEVAQRPIVAHAESIAVGTLVEQLLESVDAAMVRHDAIVLVGSRQAIERRAAERRRATIEVPPLETRVFAIGDRAHARELAQVYCHLHAGPRGAAASLGHDLVVTDTRQHLDLLEALVTSLEGASTPSAPPSAAPRP
jgi:hypothetical protein